MRRRSLPTIVTAALALLPAAAGAVRADAANPEAASGFGRVPLHFERNDGQWDEEVRFLARGPGYALFLGNEGPVLKLLTPGQGPQGARGAPRVLRLRLGGSKRASTIEPSSALPGVSHYYAGSDRLRWRTNQRHFGRVTYSGVYPGIDVAYYGNQRQLEYDFLLKPGADPGRIRMRFDGARALAIDARGDLVLETSAGKVIQRAPVAYQEAHGRRTEVAVRFERHGRETGFRLGAYDTTRTLVIDPVLVYSTYLGGSEIPPPFFAEAIAGVGVDASGSAYVAGHTPSPDFPLASAQQGTHAGGLSDLFVTRFSPAGDALVFSTFLGGSDAEVAYGLALDPAGNAYLCGYTESPDFPTLEPYQSSLRGVLDAFVAKISADGLLRYATYLGGAENDAAHAIAVNAGGEATVAGGTLSDDFPTTPGAFQTDQRGGDAFVTRLDAAGSALVASTYLGGSGSTENAYGVAIDSTGNTYVVGETSSPDFPTQKPYQADLHGGLDAFVARLNPALSALHWSTYLGGGSWDLALGVAIDRAGRASVVGGTDSSDFPTRHALQGDQVSVDGFVTKLAADGAGLVFSTYLGGFGFADYAMAVGLDAAQNVYVSGTTNSPDFPTRNAVQGRLNDWQDAFVTKLSPNGRRLLYSTYLGSFNDDHGAALALGSASEAYVAGSSFGPDFPLATPFQPAMKGMGDAFVSKLSGFVKGDFNRDSRTDLVFRHELTGQNAVWMMNGTTRLGRPVPIAPAAASLDWRIAGVDDFDGNETNDLVFWNHVTGAAEIWLMDGTTRSGSPIALAGAPAPPWRLAATADFDRDGGPDLVWHNRVTRDVLVWTMNGTAHSGTLVPTPGQGPRDADWEIAAALDYNGDSHTDLLWQQRSSGDALLWFMDEEVRLIEARPVEPPPGGPGAGGTIVAGGDYGAGSGGTPATKDIVLRNPATGGAAVWFMDTAGVLTSGSATVPEAPLANPTGWTIVGPR